MTRQIFSSERQSALNSLALSLLSLLGFEAALRTRQENGWIGVRSELLKIRAA